MLDISSRDIIVLQRMYLGTRGVTMWTHQKNMSKTGHTSDEIDEFTEYILGRTESVQETHE